MGCQSRRWPASGPLGASRSPRAPALVASEALRAEARFQGLQAGCLTDCAGQTAGAWQSTRWDPGVQRSRWFRIHFHEASLGAPHALPIAGAAKLRRRPSADSPRLSGVKEHQPPSSRAGKTSSDAACGATAVTSLALVNRKENHVFPLIQITGSNSHSVLEHLGSTNQGLLRASIIKCRQTMH